MSLISFIKKLIRAIGDLFTKLPAETKSAVHVGVVVTELVKKAVDSFAADVITALIPGDWDDNLKLLLRKNLPDILVKMRLVDRTLGLTDPEEIVKAALQTLNELGGLSNKDAHNLSIMIAMVAADGKLTWGDAVYVLEYYYKEKYQPAAAA